MLSPVLAVLAAAGTATASVLQRRAGAGQPEGEAGGLRLLWRLARRPDWLGGIVALVIGFLLQAAALAIGPIAVVQPTMMLELPFTLLLAQVAFRSRLHHREWGGVLGMAGGLAGLLYALQPQGGHPAGVSVAVWAIGISTMLGITVVCTVIGYLSAGTRRAAYLGVATGIGFGLTGVLVAGIGAAYQTAGIGGLFAVPLTYLFIVLGPCYFFLLQKTMQAGSLVASQPGLTLSDPVVGIVFGTVVFGEQVRTGGWLVLAVAGAVAAAACTAVLARSPVLRGGASDAEVGAGEVGGREM